LAGLAAVSVPLWEERAVDDAIDTNDLNEPLFIKPFIQRVLDAASVCRLDAEMLREQDKDGRVWDIAAEELVRAAIRIEERTKGLPDVMRHDPRWEEPAGTAAVLPTGPAATTERRRHLRLIRT
jgi:hypothetical protein